MSRPRNLRAGGGGLTQSNLMYKKAIIFDKRTIANSLN